MRFNAKLLAMVIRERRLKLNYSQDYIAKKTGMSQTAYSKLEQGHTTVTLEKFIKLCMVLETDMAGLLREYAASANRMK